MSRRRLIGLRIDFFARLARTVTVCSWRGVACPAKRSCVPVPRGVVRAEWSGSADTSPVPPLFGLTSTRPLYGRQLHGGSICSR